MKNTRVLVFMALFIAMDVILTRFLSIQTPIIRIGFGFIPVALAGMMFGPAIGGVTAALGDIIGMIVFPKGAYFPGFTLSAFLTGATYGLVLYKKPKSILRIFLAVAVVVLFIDIGLTTVWVSMTTSTAYKALLFTRVTKLAMIPVEVAVNYALWKCIALTGSSFLQKIEAA
ncbi:MAG: folate family ECF transporter S component [Clostridiales bacterium]|jgi:ECF transporter S component (folate family)|nr:folate family ECF transporter S component [Eubacteriales bacterium]MDH7566767.1 folate family ECF transporter S component [Clostridiales bacterium]